MSPRAYSVGLIVTVLLIGAAYVGVKHRAPLAQAPLHPPAPECRYVGWDDGFIAIRTTELGITSLADCPETLTVAQ